MRVLMTGVTGIGKKDYARRVQELAATRGVLVETIHLERLMRECDLTGTFREDTMYQRRRMDFLQLLCGMTLRDEVRKRAEAAEQAGVHHVILEMHATYFWDQAPFTIASPAHIAAWFHPDLVITLIDDVHEIFAMLRERRDVATERLLANGNPIINILQWRSFETTTSEHVAHAARTYDQQRDLHVPGFFLIPKALGPDPLVQLLTESTFARAAKPKRIVYASFAISRLKGNDPAMVAAREAVDRFRSLLKEHFILLDPYAITEKLLADAGAKSNGSPVEMRLRNGSIIEIPHDIVTPAASLIDGQIVERDERLVRSADAVVVYFPTDPSGYPYPSEGAAFERITGWLQGKEVIVVTEATQEKRGPFALVATATCANFDEAIAWFRAHGWIT